MNLFSFQIILISGINVVSQWVQKLFGSKDAIHLPTPDEGCGVTKVKNTRIVGGSVAPVGAWPWFTALAYKNLDDDEVVFNCGKNPKRFFYQINYLKQKQNKLDTITFRWLIDHLKTCPDSCSLRFTFYFF